MKKKDRNMLMLAGAGGLGIWYYMSEKKKKEGLAVAGVGGEYPGVGAMVPDAAWIPEGLRGKPSPLWLDVALWGGVGTAVGYFALAGKKL